MTASLREWICKTTEMNRQQRALTPPLQPPSSPPQAAAATAVAVASTADETRRQPQEAVLPTYASLAHPDPKQLQDSTFSVQLESRNSSLRKFPSYDNVLSHHHHQHHRQHIAVDPPTYQDVLAGGGVRGDVETPAGRIDSGDNPAFSADGLGESPEEERAAAAASAASTSQF